MIFMTSKILNVTHQTYNCSLAFVYLQLLDEFTQVLNQDISQMEGKSTADRLDVQEVSRGVLILII